MKAVFWLVVLSLAVLLVVDAVSLSKHRRRHHRKENEKCCSCYRVADAADLAEVKEAEGNKEAADGGDTEAAEKIAASRQKLETKASLGGFTVPLGDVAGDATDEAKCTVIAASEEADGLASAFTAAAALAGKPEADVWVSTPQWIATPACPAETPDCNACAAVPCVAVEDVADSVDWWWQPAEEEESAKQEK
eukprot:gnl/Hemi2/23918_TR8029_c0_g1_i1.p2 gnl/Hemi2/23918_TR8029_c0_g1~~gnl/Hemi2/23918_TR8029_c0_g1_i1.p2  ORF type:complete len:193 (+),score=75.92 gnl/Hemi2/23918_TR8029_c0_g1_i1:46-624(+)